MFVLSVLAALAILPAACSDGSSADGRANGTPSPDTTQPPTRPLPATTPAASVTPATVHPATPRPAATTADPARSPTATPVLPGLATPVATPTAAGPTATHTPRPPSATPTAPSTPTPTTPPAPLAATVYMRDNYFSERTVTIRAGGSVTWVHDGTQYHNARGDFFDTGTSNEDGPRPAVTFATPGTYGYVCDVHLSPPNNMRGTVVVLP